ncbi:MAG: DUF4249 family protein [Bacteroidota bacterium]
MSIQLKKHSNPEFGTRSRIGTALLMVVMLLITACSDDFIDPFENEGRYFTVYGFIDSQKISHKIRVIPVTRHQAVIRKESDIQAALDAEVTISDLSTGEVVEWEYGLEKLEDGTFAHIFRSDFIVIPGRRYRLDVTRSDGVRAWAETRVPHIPDSAFFDLGQIQFSPDSSEVLQDILMQGELNPWAFEAIYAWSGDFFNRRVFVPYGRRGEQVGAGGWRTQLSISADQAAVFETIRESLLAGKIQDDTPLILTGAGLRMTMLDTNWDLSDGAANPNTLAFPEAGTNINNGYGFFGSIGHYVQEWEACELSGPLGYEYAEANCGARDQD